MTPTKHIPLVLFIIIFALSFNSIFAQADKQDATVKDEEEEVYKLRRLRMVERDIKGKGKGVKDKKVLEAMRTVKRHEFVPPEEHIQKAGMPAYRWLQQAYADHPLPIGFKQTISQPYIVAFMTEMLKPKKEHKVLEIGTGSGYQAAVLAEIVDKVYTIEIIEKLGKQAKERLKRLKYENIEVKIGDGYYGWEEHAPFDSIIVTAAAEHIPPPLIKQLKKGGRMCIPVGSPFFVQNLMLLEKREDGEVRTKRILPVRFVPLVSAKKKD